MKKRFIYLIAAASLCLLSIPFGIILINIEAFFVFGIVITIIFGGAFFILLFVIAHNISIWEINQSKQKFEQILKMNYEDDVENGDSDK